MRNPAPGDRRQGRPTTTWAGLLTADAATRHMTCADLDALPGNREAYRLQAVYAGRKLGQKATVTPRQ